jgi:hypothetical protein
MHPSTVREGAKAGIIPAAKPGKEWVFIEADLLDYLRTQGRLACRSTGEEEVASGGSTSSRHMAESDIDDLLESVKRRVRSESTTSSRPSSGRDNVVELSTARSMRGSRTRGRQTNTK